MARKIVRWVKLWVEKREILSRKIEMIIFLE